MSSRINPHLNAVLDALGVENKKYWTKSSPDQLGRLVRAIADRAKEHTQKQLSERGIISIDYEKLTLVPKSHFSPKRHESKIGAKPFSFPEGGNIL